MDTFVSLQNQVLANLDESGDTGTTLTLVKNFLNQAHQQRVTMEKWPFMLWPELPTFTTVLNQETYTLHPEFARPLYFFNRTTASYLTEIPFRQLQASAALWNTDSGSLDQFYLEGAQPVASQPSSSSVLTIVSSNAADNTSGKAITVRGMTANGVTSESLTPNGTTPVVSTNAFTLILNVTKAASWTGTMTMTSNTGAVTNLVLFPTELGRHYTRLFALRLPTAGESIEYRFFRKPTVLSADDDMPDIPPPFSQILVWDTLLLFAGYNSGVSEGAMLVWKEKRTEIELAMRQTYLEGQTLGAMPRFIRDLNEAGSGRIRTIG